VGDVIGKFHPHGDQAVYDTLVRMAQDFNMRYPLVNGQGNFGSIDGDPPAAMRYTEARLQALADDLMGDLDKETVDFVPNYDETTEEPTVLPAPFPNLLVNGSAGIAVGMATNVPPHNISEIISACLLLLHQPGTTIDELIELVPAPDFPTAGIIYRAGNLFDRVLYYRNDKTPTYDSDPHGWLADPTLAGRTSGEQQLAVFLSTGQLVTTNPAWLETTIADPNDLECLHYPDPQAGQPQARQPYPASGECPAPPAH